MRKLKLRLVLAVLLALHSCHALVQPKIPFSSVYFYFDAPRTQVSHFYVNKTVDLIGGDTGENVQDLKAVLEGDIKNIGLTAYFDRKSAYVPANSTVSLILTFKIPSSVKSGKYRGSITIQGSGISTTTRDIVVEVEHPPPTVRVLWDNQDMGKVKAGESYTKKLTVEEYYGYRDAGNVTITIPPTGHVSIYPEQIAVYLKAGEKKTFDIKITVHNRSIIPGNYTISPQVKAEFSISVKEVKSLSYTIPYPVLLFTPRTVDFGRLTFEPEKDIAERTLVITEGSGYTPLENLRLSVEQGENWIQIDSPEYVPPGGNATAKLKLTLPPYATLGVKEWKLALRASYTERVEIPARAIVYFPGLEEASKELASLKPQDKRIKEAVELTYQVVQKAKSETEVGRISSALLVYTGMRSFYEQMQLSGDVFSRARQLVLASAYLSRIKAGSIFYEEASQVYNLLREVWMEEYRKTSEVLEKKAGEGNLREKAISYKYLKRLSIAAGDPYERYAEEQKKAERDYARNIENAYSSRGRAEQFLHRASIKCLVLGDNYIVLNPFVYERVVNLLEMAKNESVKAEELFAEAGEEEELIVQHRFTQKLTTIERRTKQLFNALLAFLVMFFSAYIAMVTLGVQRYIKDEEEIGIGDVILRS